MPTRKLLLFCLLTFCSLFFIPRPGHAVSQNAEAVTAAQAADIDEVIRTLEDPGAREELLRQLKIMARAQQQVVPQGQTRSTASKALQGIFTRLNRMSEAVMALAGYIREIPHAISWAQKELATPLSRKAWQRVFFNLAVVLGAGYMVYFMIGWAVMHLRRTMIDASQDQFFLRALRLLVILFLDLLPVIAFALAGYLFLGLIAPQEKISLVAIAWINAFMITHSIVAVANFILAPSSPALRWSDIADETANYLLIWTKRISYSTVYGYFTLQAALLLGVPLLSYEVLLRLLGLLVTVLVMIMILQNREGVSRQLLHSPEEEQEEAGGRQTARHLRKRLAQTWYLLALVYVALLYGVWALQVEDGFIFLMRATLLTLVTLLCTRLLLHGLAAAFNRGFQISEELQAKFPLLEERSNRYLLTVHRAVKGLIYLLGGMVILQSWGVHTFAWLVSKQGKVLGGTMVSIIAIVLVAFLIWEVSSALIESYLNRKDQLGLEPTASARTRTLLAVARKALTIVLTVVTSLMVLSELGVDIAPLLAGAGVLGLAVGFGSQKLVQDVITGIFILLEDQIAVGDVVNVGDKGGLVEAVSIRTVRLRDLSGTVHTIPFSSINIVSNLTKEFSFYVMDVGVAYREDVNQVMQVLRDLGAEMQADEEYGPKILEPLEVLGVDAFADSAVVIKARIKTAPIKQWWIGREFNRRMKVRFDELGIEIPFPHSTIYFGENKGGGAPPAMVRIAPVAMGEAATEVSST